MDEILDLGPQKSWTRFQSFAYIAMIKIKDKIQEREKENAKRNKGKF